MSFMHAFARIAKSKTKGNAHKAQHTRKKLRELKKKLSNYVKSRKLKSVLQFETGRVA